MSDSLFFSLWFRNYDMDEMFPHLLSVMRQFPFSALRPGTTYLAIHPVSWTEATIFERRFEPAVPPEEAVDAAADLLHDDYAYVFEAFWDLWMPPDEDSKGEWVLRPSPVKFIAHGPEFERGVLEQEGHVQVEFGLDAPFLQEGVELTQMTEAGVRANVQKLVEFTVKLEKNTDATGRLLWSDSGENLAQKLIARLQKVQ